jgi:hypothetical protein
MHLPAAAPVAPECYRLIDVFFMFALDLEPAAETVVLNWF